MSLRIAIGLMIAGFVVGVWQGKEIVLASQSSKEPALVTCKQLTDDGPPKNRHIVLTDFCSGEYIVYTTARPVTSQNYTGPYKYLYIAAMPRTEGEGQQEIEAKDIRLLLKFNNVRSDDHLTQLLDRTTLQGLLVTGVESMDWEDKKLLRDSYVGTDLERCYILEVGRKPASLLAAVGGTAGGAVMALAGLAILLWPWIQKKRQAALDRAASAVPVEQARFEVADARDQLPATKTRPRHDDSPIKFD